MKSYIDQGLNKIFTGEKRNIQNEIRITKGTSLSYDKVFEIRWLANGFNTVKNFSKPLAESDIVYSDLVVYDATGTAPPYSPTTSSPPPDTTTGNNALQSLANDEPVYNDVSNTTATASDPPNYTNVTTTGTETTTTTEEPA
jgi:hypothetical protein